MKLMVVWVFVVALATLVLAPVMFAAWNLLLAPWLGWPEMPPAVALLAGAVVAALVVRVRVRDGL